jgi:hypothetical protein
MGNGSAGHITRILGLSIIDETVKSPKLPFFVIPAKAGIQGR